MNPASCYAVIFKADIASLDDEYISLAEEMRELAAGYAGFLDFVLVTDGSKEISISYWRDLESISQFKNESRHLLAQQSGRDKFYKNYKVEVAKIEREYCFKTND